MIEGGEFGVGLGMGQGPLVMIFLLGGDSSIRRPFLVEALSRAQRAWQRSGYVVDPLKHTS